MNKSEHPDSAHSQEDIPAFQHRWLLDVNPVSGQRKKRRISNPNASMRKLLAHLLGYLRKLRVPMPNSTAGRRGDSALRNVLRHRKAGGGMKGGFNRYFVLLDISSAYQGVDLERMTDVLILVSPQLASQRDDVRSFLNDYCFDPKIGGLVTGAPASMDLFNVYCEVLIDRRLRELCETYKLVYTRYLDDLTFSSLGPIGKKKRVAIRKVVADAGFTISDKKAKVVDLRKGPAVVNGVGICLDGRIFLPRHTLTHIRGLIHQAMKGKVKAARIHGKMGLLKAISIPVRANSTELKVFRAYEVFRGISWIASQAGTSKK